MKLKVVALLVLVLYVCPASICGASYSAADLSGTWHYHELWLDQLMGYVGYSKGSGQLNGPFAVSCVSSNEPYETGSHLFASTIDANGTVSITPSTGEYTIVGQMSMSKDVIAFVNNEDGDFNFGILVKSDIITDFDGDGDTDGSDLSVITSEYGRNDCQPDTPCQADLDADGSVNDSDVELFSTNFGF